MFKYCLRVYDRNTDDLLLSSIVPYDQVFNWCDRYNSVGIIKVFVIDNESEENK